jgi:hypothetical protein
MTTSTTSTDNPGTTRQNLLTPGSFVQYNVDVQSTQAPLPSPEEQTIGIVRQAFTGQGGQFYQVVWNPGSQRPKTAMYNADQLCPLTQQAANDIIDQLAAGTYQPVKGTPGLNFPTKNIPIQAAPPANQQAGMESL